MRGQWHLRIYCCQWTLLLDEAELAHSESPDAVISRALAVLDGQALTGVAVRSDDGSTRFAFDLGCVLVTRPGPPGSYGDEPAEQWMLYQWPPPGRVLTVRGDGHCQVTSHAAPASRQDWLPLTDTGATAGAREDQVSPVPHPKLTAAWRNRVAAECRPLLEQADGMNQVQQYLADIGIEALDATVITTALLGPESLGTAKRIVLTHPARARELAWHEDLMEHLDTLIETAGDPESHLCQPDDPPDP